MRRLGWLLVNVAQAVYTAAWSVGWISLALVVRLVTGSEEATLRMARTLWSPGLLHGAGARLAVQGLEHLEAGQAYLFASTHASQIDIPVLFVALPRALRFVVKEELRPVPFLGWYLRATGMIFLRRSEKRGAIEPLGRAAELLREGHSVLVFPEGTRSRDGRLRPFKSGVFRAAIEAGAAVVPVVIEGADRVLPPGGFRVRPGRIRVTICPPLATTGLKPHQRRELAQRVQEAASGALSR